MDESHLITLSLLVVVGIACQLLAWRLRIPAILFLLTAGFIAGPVTGVFDPDALLGDLLFPFVSLGVGVILFEGSLTLHFDQISKNATVVWRLVSIGMLATLVVASAAAYYFTGINLSIALLFGAIVTVTGPTVIMPLLRSVRPSAEVSNILRWEAIVIDSLGAILAVIVYEFIILEHSSHLFITLGKLIFSGLILGFVFAGALGYVLRHHLIPDYLIKISILGYVLGVFTLCNVIQEESGLLAVTIMGMVLANTKGIMLEEILDFKESLSILIISSLFLVLSARIDLDTVVQAGPGSLLVLAAIILVARPVGVFLSTVGSKLSLEERAILGWIAPRGIIAASIAPLFALKLEAYDVADADMLTPLVFIIIVGTVVIQSLTSSPLARAIGVAEPEPSGVLIVGSGRLARAIGSALKDADFRVLLADTNWDGIKEARMLGLNTFFGNVVSEHADRHMDLMGIGKMLAITSRPSENALASMKYRREFGSKNVFIIKTEEERHTREKDYIAYEYTAPFLFGGNATQAQLTGLLASGHEIRATGLTENFTYEDFLKKHKEDALPLFVITKSHNLVPYLDGNALNPEPGATILSLLPEAEKDKSLDA